MQRDEMSGNTISMNGGNDERKFFATSRVNYG